MKKLLIATDFSHNANHAAVYGYYLAKQLRANITVCNAFIVPAEVPQAGVVVWPMDDFNTISKTILDELEAVKTKQVFVVDINLFTQPSASTLVDGIELLAALFHPQLFSVPAKFEYKFKNITTIITIAQ